MIYNKPYPYPAPPTPPITQIKPAPQVPQAPPTPAPVAPFPSPRGPVTDCAKSVSHTRRKDILMTNGFQIAGVIAQKGLQYYHDKVARFTLVTKGSDSNVTPLYTDCVYFCPRGGALPIQLLQPGKKVVISGFMRASTWTDAAGAKHYRVDHVADQIIEIRS